MIRTPVDIERAVLEYLVEARDNIYNPTNIPASGQTLARDLGIPKQQIEEVWRLSHRYRAEKGF